MTIHQIFWCLIYLSLFILSPYGYTENQFLVSSQESIQFEQKQRLESELSQRQLLEKQKKLILDDSRITPLQDEKCFPVDHIKLVGITALSNLPESAFVDTCANCVEVFKK